MLASSSREERRVEPPSTLRSKRAPVAGSDRRAHAGARVAVTVVIVVVVVVVVVALSMTMDSREPAARRALAVTQSSTLADARMRDVDVARASETDDDVDETVAHVASRARASASPSSAVRAVLLQIRRAHWRWSAALSLFAAGVLFATQYGTLEGVRRVSDGYVTRAASLTSTSPTAAFANRERAVIGPDPRASRARRTRARRGARGERRRLRGGGPNAREISRSSRASSSSARRSCNVIVVRRARNRLLVSAIEDASFRRHAIASARLARARGEDVVRVAVDAGARENARARRNEASKTHASRASAIASHPGPTRTRVVREWAATRWRANARVRQSHVGVRGDVSAGRVRAGGGSRAGDE